MKFQQVLLTATAVAVALATTADAFVVLPRVATHRFSSPLFALPEIDTMRITEIRQELESYGISTKVFLEKKEMVTALNNARAEGKTAKEEPEVDSSKMSRDEKLKSEMEKAKKMKVGDIKKDLEGRGISTKSFFEKSEFVKAYAEAVVDGVKGKKRRAADPPPEEEKFDPEYREVVMQKFNARDPRLMQSKVIDVRAGS